MSYAMMTEEEARAHTPIVVIADEKNQPREVRGSEQHGTIG